MKKIDSGYRLPPPPGCPRKIYDLMIKCWWAFCSASKNKLLMFRIQYTTKLKEGKNYYSNRYCFSKGSNIICQDCSLNCFTCDIMRLDWQWIIYHRHPDPSRRTSFQDLKDALFLSDSNLLAWDEEEEENCHCAAMKLGASLQAAEGLYLDLPNTYKSSI